MKFGDTLYRRSVPKWAAYNVNYNEIKRLIKERTSVGLGVPVAIPAGPSNNRWAALEDDLVPILKEQHDNVCLFLKSKYGEIDRRLSYLEKQVKVAVRLTEASYTTSPAHGRRYQKLLEEAESIGQDIQNLTRFASVQKTAFRKILKKYRKWTGSTSLQTRLEVEVFGAGQLNLDYAHPLERLSAQTKIITEQLQGPLLRGESPSNNLSAPATKTSVVTDINAASESGPIALDAALATIPFGKSAGLATYWIHPDNLDEAQALLLRHVREIHKTHQIARENSDLSMSSGRSRNQSTDSGSNGNYIAYFDNPQRYLQDKSDNRPSKIALSGRWCQSSESVVTLSNLAPWNPSGSIINLRRKDILKALSREDNVSPHNQKMSKSSANLRRVVEYLSEHRDVKPLAQVHSVRTRYTGTGNSSQAGTWAVLDSDVVISPFRSEDIHSLEEDAETGEAFPHAVLEIRWEFSHTPEVVRAFDATHLAERVRGFTLESAAVHTNNKDLTSPSWKSLLEKDIRKVPLTTKATMGRRGSFSRGRVPAIGTSSGPSSTDGPADSIFSSQNAQSSSTSVNSRDITSPEEALQTTSKALPQTPKRAKKKARIDAQSPPPRQSRYWNEFDDGDEDVNPQEAYMIYVDPNETFPGTETISKVFGAMHRSLEGAATRVSSMFSLKSREKPKKQWRNHERTGLLDPYSRHNSDEADSSDSDTTPIQESVPDFGTFLRSKPKPRSSSILPVAPKPVATTTYRPHQVLTPRQKALEHTYFLFYTGLIVLSYILLFVSGVLLSAGRKRAYIEVDIAVVAAISTAEICAVTSIILVWMRKSPLSIIHWSIVSVAIIGIVVAGIGEIVVMANRPVKR